MNRQILFRGLTASNEWVEGDLYHFDNKYFVGVCDETKFVENEVKPESIGQFTGLHDKNGKRIFEGQQIKDVLTNAVYTVKIGFCKRYAFTGVYCENEARQVPITNDSNSDRDSMIEIIETFENNNKIKP